MRATLIVNPYASAVGEERVRAVERELAAAYELRTVLTEGRGHAVELARAAEGEAVFAFGGDGVFNEVLNGVDGTRPLGFVPGGGTNVLPRALGLPEDPVAAARLLVAARVRRISLGRVNGRRFAFGAGIGLDSAAVRHVDARGRRADGKRPGDVAFALAVVSVVRASGWRLRDRLVLEPAGGEDAGETARDRRDTAALVVVSNNAIFTYAGPVPFRFSPAARFELGLDYVALSRPHAARIAAGLARAALGLGIAGLAGAIAGHDVDRLVVRCCEPYPLQADGEDLGDVAEAVFEAERDAVGVLVPS
ncbi:MAG TPA: diacylglycerol kinase family protein [Gaiellaceae bacterium]|nr:diacylglycerol kinase family protein [Gaiellaceae bacterium]